MGSRNYAYQYETSPRKLKPEYDIPKKKSQNRPKKNTINKAVKPKSKIAKSKQKAREARIARINFGITILIVLLCILFMMYRSVKINEAFNEVQVLSKNVSDIEKENSQIAVNIQNSLNLSNIESVATSTLGMQKLSNKQTIYITLDTKDYVEISSNKIEKEQEKGFFQKVFDKLSNIF